MTRKNPILLLAVGLLALSSVEANAASYTFQTLNDTVTGGVEIQKSGGFKMLFNYGHILPH
jgi:hypothetical protein